MKDKVKALLSYYNPHNKGGLETLLAIKGDIEKILAEWEDADEPVIKWEKIKYDYWMGIYGRLLFQLNAIFVDTDIMSHPPQIDYWELEIQYQNNMTIDDHRFDTGEQAKEFAVEWIKLLFKEDAK